MAKTKSNALYDIYRYKNRLMGEIVTDEKLVKLINPDYTLDDAPKLIYQQVFPYEYIPQTIDSGYTYICFDVDVSKVTGRSILSPVLYIWVMSHRSKLRLTEGGVRPDTICSILYDKLDGSKYYGMGSLQFYAAKRFAPLTDYQGKLMTFTMEEYSRGAENIRPSIPSNRKLS